jgi:hypothetical protein
MTPLECVFYPPSLPIVMVTPPPGEKDVRTYVVLYQTIPGETCTYGEPEDNVNDAVFTRNRLWRERPEIGRIWINLVSAGQILRRWGAEFQRPMLTITPAVD